MVPVTIIRYASEFVVHFNIAGVFQDDVEVHVKSNDNPDQNLQSIALTKFCSVVCHFQEHSFKFTIRLTPTNWEYEGRFESFSKSFLGSLFSGAK